MRRSYRLAALLAALSIFLFSCTSKAQITLALNGASEYKIVLPEAPSQYEKKAAEELRAYLEKISGASLPVVSDTEGLSAHEIILGSNAHLGSAGIKVKTDKLDKDGFHILTRGNYLVIAGGSEKGTLYGVYTFLEEYLGCRFYTPEAIHVPASRTVTLGTINDMQVPVFDFREMYFPVMMDSSYLLWHKLDRHQRNEWGMWVHTFDDLVPPQDYFDEHPEYFSMVGTKRVNDGQLCLANPAVFDLVVENLGKKIEKNPEAQYWSVSQNDNYSACECDQCKALDEKWGGPSGTMIDFVNRVAEQFPDHTISTLAYQYTRHAPKGIKPAGNVNVMLCSIECNRSIPIAEDPSSASFVKDLKDWSKLTGNILLWDYVVQFRNYVSPFPNFHVLQPNLKLFEKYGCSMMFQQGSGRAWSDMSELKSYLVAKLLWNPDADAEDITNDFIYGYYGEAGPFIRQYFDMTHQELKRSGRNLWIYGYPSDAADSYLSPALVHEYRLLFDEAEKAVKDKPAILARVKRARLPLEFAILDISLLDRGNEFSYFEMSNGKVSVNETRAMDLDIFVDGCKAAGVGQLNEQGTTPEFYRDNVARFVNLSLEENKAKGKTIIVQTPFSGKYNPRGGEALVDGLRGILDYNFNWLGFEGEDLVATVDLGEPTVLSGLSMDFFQFTRSWIFLPQEVSFYISENGVDFEPISTILNMTPDSRPGMFISTFSTDVPGLVARYVKVEAVSLKTCPEWHIGAGEKCWIFSDEIVIR